MSDKSWRFLAVLLWAPIIGALNGWILRLLWRWFIVPLGVPPVGVVQAYGIALIVTFCVPKKIDDEDVPLAKIISYGLAHSLVCLGFGAAAKAVMP